MRVLIPRSSKLNLAPAVITLIQRCGYEKGSAVWMSLRVFAMSWHLSVWTAWLSSAIPLCVLKRGPA